MAASEYIYGAKARREDISRFIVHLTKDFEGRPAPANLLSILETHTIYARNHYCLFENKLKEHPTEIREKFYVACMTETPLNQVKNMFNIEVRAVNFKPYGIVFNKSDIEDSYYGSPCIYANGKNKDMIKAYWEMFKSSKANSFADGFPQIGALIHMFNKDKDFDFSWEREWRVLGDSDFKPQDVIAIISEDNTFKVPDEYRHAPLINPEWGYEEMILRIARQSLK